MGTKLSAQRVGEIFRDCLSREGEDESSRVKAEGIMSVAEFHPGRLKSYKTEIASMLEDLPDEFKGSGGGGMSFLQACVDKRGVQWGEHIDMERLFQLGIAIGKVKSQFPRKLWASLPGGMPYYIIE